METISGSKGVNKSLQKRFIIFFLFFSLILAITLGSATTPFEELSKKTLVLKQNPDFVILKDVSSKNTAVEYKILFTFYDFKDSLNVSGADLEFADRKAIQQELKSGDTVDVVYHENFLYLSQVSKNDKHYMNPAEAYKNGDAMNKFVLWVSIIGAVTCLIGFFLNRFAISYSGWLCTGIILTSIIILFLSFGVKFADAREYPEFSTISSH